MKLAEALLRRKDLQNKVDRLKTIDKESLYKTETGRGPVTDGFNDMIAKVNVVSFQQYTHCYDWHSKQLRLVDGVIQRANWETDVEITDQDYIDPYVKTG